MDAEWRLHPIAFGSAARRRELVVRHEDPVEPREHGRRAHDGGEECPSVGVSNGKHGDAVERRAQCCDWRRNEALECDPSRAACSQAQKKQDWYGWVYFLYRKMQLEAFMYAVLMEGFALGFLATGGQRVVVFIGSPIAEDDKTLTKIGKLLKKNNIAVDVISMGEVDANAAKLQVFVDAANSNNNSHLVTVPAGVLPSDVLVSSPVLHGEDSPMVSGGGASAGGDSFAEYGGIDPSMDPELALALRVSMEEERARQEAAQKRAAEEAKQQESAPAVEDAKPASPKKSEESAPKAEPKREEEEDVSAAPTGIPPPAPAAPVPASNLPFMDPTFVNSLLSGLPGVDPNDPKIQAAMAQMNKKDDSKDEEKKEDK